MLKAFKKISSIFIRFLKYELLFEEPFLSNVTKRKNKILRFPYQQSVKVHSDEFL